MDLLLISLVALVASGLTLFSGFGLGTLLLPAFALFFPVPAAIAMTAVVHLANNLFKLALVGKYVHLGTVLRFGITAVPAAWIGALWLGHLGNLAPLFFYSLGDREFAVTPVKLCIAGLLALFALLESLPDFSRIALPPRWLPLGGALSGFFGGLSGQQGALRSAFLLRAGLGKEGFIGTGVVLACLVDITRLPLYAEHFTSGGVHPAPVTLAVLSAWLGSYFGARLFPKTTYATVQRAVAGLLLLLAVLLAAGVV